MARSKLLRDYRSFRKSVTLQDPAGRQADAWQHFGTILSLAPRYSFGSNDIAAPFMQ